MSSGWFLPWGESHFLNISAGSVQPPLGRRDSGDSPLEKQERKERQQRHFDQKLKPVRRKYLSRGQDMLFISPWAGSTDFQRDVHSMMHHSFIIIREVLILTLSIFIPLQRCICLYPLATGMILNEMINSDHNIQSHPCPQRCTDQYCP